MRLFVALDLPEPVLAPLAAWRARAFAGRDDLRLPAAESLHVTLAFLGYMEGDAVERVAACAFAERAGRFALRAGGVVGLPRRRPRLFALELADLRGTLGGWQERLSRRLHEAGLYEPEKRAFWPHVTLARSRGTPGRGRGERTRERPAPAPGAIPELPPGLRDPFFATRMTLYRSELRREGARYEPMAASAAPE